MNRSTRVVWLALLLVPSGWVVAPQGAAAATIVVNETEDENNGDGDCSLREAIQSANGDTSFDNCTEGDGLDTIQVPSGRFKLHLGQLYVSTAVSIQGAGKTQTFIERDLEENNIQRILAIEGPVAIISDLTIANGSGNTTGGGIFHGAGDLFLRRVMVRDNVGTEGGGIKSTADLDIEDSVVKDNSTGGNGGGIWVDGSLTMTETTVSGNQAEYGGGLYVAAPTALIDRSTFSGNSVTGSGGGINVEGSATTFLLQNSTLTNNVAYTSANVGVSYGGGLRNAGVAILANVTITNNRAKTYGSGLLSDGYASTSTTVRNSVVSDNPKYNGTVDQENCYVLGDFTSEGYNLENGTTCDFTAPNDLPPANPKLAPLRMNGGLTKTHALQPSSPALDAGEPEDAPSNGCRPTDQRGMPRPKDGPDANREARCDVGAFEMRLTRHRRDITLNLKRHLVAKGRITLPDFYSPCAKNVRVLVQRKKDGDWVTVADPTSRQGGFYSAHIPDKEGVYRAQIKTSKLFRGDLHICKKSTADTKDHKH